MSTNVFNDVKRSSKPGKVFLIVIDVIPRSLNSSPSRRLEREESEVAVSHVAILGAEQKLRRNNGLRMTEHDHCITTRIGLPQAYRYANIFNLVP